MENIRSKSYVLFQGYPEVLTTNIFLEKINQLSVKKMMRSLKDLFYMYSRDMINLLGTEKLETSYVINTIFI